MTVGALLWGGLGLWLALNGAIAMLLVRRTTTPSERSFPGAVVLPLRQPT